MNKYITPLLTIIVTFMLLAPPAFAWRSVRTGQRTFERAWLAYVSLQQDKADEFFKDAATAFSTALAVDPPSRTSQYASTLTMAGISFYYAGKYEECITTMELAHGKDNKIWEANIFIALSNARLGNKDNALEFLILYLQSMPSQRNLSKAVMQQIEDIETGSRSLEEGIGQIEKALPLQFINNINLNNASRSSNPAIERCGGAYWWRKNRSPCFETGYGLNSM